MSIPHWQQQACPDWCTSTHLEDDHPHDRTHRDPGVAIPVVLRRQAFEGDELHEHREASEIVLGRIQRDGDAQLWYFLGEEGGPALELSAESYARLVQHMRAIAD